MIAEHSHRAAEQSALWPSIRADLVFWGNVTEFPDEVVIEPYLTRTALSRRRNVMPEILEARFELDGEIVDLSIGNSAAFFDLEPIVFRRSLLARYSDFELGIPICATADAPEPLTNVNEPLFFRRITDDAAYVQYRGEELGWIRFPQIPREDLTMFDFAQGLVQILRGNWRAAESAFSELVNRQDLPNALRVDAYIYLGIAAEKQGGRGTDHFRRAWWLNAFDSDAARFLLLGLLSDGWRDGELTGEFWEILESTQILFTEDDPWIGDLRRSAEHING